MKIIPLSEGSFTIDKTKLFVPFDPSKDQLQKRSSGSLLVEIQPFLVVTAGDILVLDTGLGFSNADGPLQIQKNIMDAGINPSEVTKVLLTHLHKDHAGGISAESENPPGSKMTFSNATYYVQKKELEFAFEKGLPSYVVKELESLKTSSQVSLLDGNGIIDGYITYEVSGAHSPYHQVFWIVDEGETLFFGGDESPQLQQMKSRFVNKYDFNGKKSMELRKKWWAEGEKNNWKFLFYHDIKTPVFSFA